MRAASCVLGAALALSSLAAPAAAQEPRALAMKARAVLETHCHRCHGKDGANEGGFNYVLDLRQLVSRRKVVPGEPGKSRLLKRIANENDPMPPPEEKVRPSAAELAVLRQWIEAGAPEAEALAKRTFVSHDEMLRAVAADLKAAPPRDRPFLRYFTLTHLHNAGATAEELQSFRHGLSKLVNSLSWNKRIVVPKRLGPAETVLRIDLRDYQWNEKSWEQILARNPYGVTYETDDAKYCAEETKCPLPYVRADWFVAVAGRPPLYHDLLQLPTNERDLEKLLRVDVAENVRQERVARAGFNGSGVSRNNRLIERHEAGGTVYWKSYDFGGNVGRQNLFAQPLGPGDDEASFQHDGGEIIFSLPNGLQGYFLTDGKGQRIDKGPTAIVSDPRRPDRAVENGLSCMSCHARGIIEKTDQVRPHLVKNRAAFAKSTADKIEALYPPAADMVELMRADAKRFQLAVRATGAPLSTTEPIAALAARFESEMDLALVAAESGVSPATLLKALDRFPYLAKNLGPLRTEGGTVQRQVFVDTFAEVVDALRLGKVQSPPNVAADKLVRRGYDLLAKQPRAALKAFDDALLLDPDNAAAHAGRGDLFRNRGELSEAIAAYGEAIRIDPRSATTLNNRGIALQRKGDLEKAHADFTAALRLDPKFAVAYHNRGTIHYAKGELDRAIADYTEALDLDPQFARAFNNRGYAFLDKEDYDKAVADFDRAIKLDTKLTAAWNNRGLAHLRKDRLKPALADFDEAIRLDPEFARAYFNRATVYTRLGNTARATDDRRRALKLDPTLDDD